MSATLNKVTIIGRLGKDPEIRQTQSGQSIASMSVATEDTWRDKQSGERKSRTEWHRVVVFNEKLSEIVEKYIRKGDLVYLEGQLATRKWTDQSGADRYTTEVVLPRFGGLVKMLGSKNGGGDDRGGHGSSPQQGTTRGRQPSQADLDDDIPF